MRVHNKDLPQGQRPVLAAISHVGDLGLESWHEVVYYDDDIRHCWCSFFGSKTFEDGEQVEEWVYTDECFDETNK